MSATRHPDFSKSFSEFVRSPRLARLAGNERLYRLGGRIAVDRVYGYEELDVAMTDVSDRLGIELDLPHAKGSGGAGYRELYGPGDAAVVAALFARTLRDFDYSF